MRDDGGLVLVDRRLTGGRAYEWRVMFPTSARDASALFADDAGLSETDAAIYVTARANGEVVPLQFGMATDDTSRTASCLAPYDASVAALEVALEDLTASRGLVVPKTLVSSTGDDGGDSNNIGVYIFMAFRKKKEEEKPKAATK